MQTQHKLHVLLLDGTPCNFQFTINLPSCGGDTNEFKEPEGSIANSKQITMVIAPNPAADQVFITYKNTNNNSTIELYDLLGRTIANYAITTTNGVIMLPINEYPTGIYIVVLRTNGVQVTQQKLIVK